MRCPIIWMAFFSLNPKIDLKNYYNRNTKYGKEGFGLEQNFETLGEMMNIEDSCDKDNPPPQKKKRKWIKMLLIVLFVGAGVFLSNWYIEIDINALPNEIKTSAEMEIPKSYLRGRWFCKDGMEINTKQEEIHLSSKFGKYTNQYCASFIFFLDKVKKE